MRRSITGRVLAALALLMLLSAAVLPGAHAAKGPGKPKPPKPPKPPKAAKAGVTWSMNGVPVHRLQETLTPGATTSVKLMFTSATALSNVQFRMSGGLGRYATVTPVSLAAVQPNVPIELTLTFTPPAQKAHTQAGVMHARAGNRALGRPLQIKLKVAKPTSRGRVDAD